MARPQTQHETHGLFQRKPDQALNPSKSRRHRWTPIGANPGSGNSEPEVGEASIVERLLDGAADRFRTDDLVLGDRKPITHAAVTRCELMSGIQGISSRVTR